MKVSKVYKIFQSVLKSVNFMEVNSVTVFLCLNSHMSQPQDLYLQVPEELRREDPWHDDESGFSFLSAQEMSKNPFHHMVVVAKNPWTWNLLFYVPEHSGWYLTLGDGGNPVDRRDSMDYLTEHKPPHYEVYSTWREAINQS